MSRFEQSVDRLIGEGAELFSVSPSKFEAVIVCDYADEVDQIVDAVTRGKFAKVELLDVDDKANRVELEIDALSRGEAVSIVNKVINDLHLSESARLLEVSPPGFSGTTAKMKKGKKISNPFALSWWMYKKGYKPRIKPEDNPEGTKNYVPPEKYKKESKEREVTEDTTTASIPTIPWPVPPLYGLSFNKKEQDECIDHISRMYPGLSKEQLRKMIFGEEEKKDK